MGGYVGFKVWGIGFRIIRGTVLGVSMMRTAILGVYIWAPLSLASSI